MARVSSDDVIVLGKRRRKRLVRIVARASAPQHLVLRAKIVLAAWRGHANAEIARDLRVGVDTVRKWRRRFRREGIPGLFDRARPGRPPVYGISDQLLIVATVTGQTPEVDSHWTHRGIAEHLHEQVGISASQVGRILASFDVKPHRVRGWLNRPADPAFHLKAQAVCALYLDPPADTVLFSVDEKTAMQARSRKRATRPARAGQPERREFEYVRHGTLSLMAAMNVITGTVHPKIIKRNDSDTFIEFLTELAATLDPTMKIHLILDNGSSHTSKQTRKWLAENPRFTVTYTPCHASWLNMIEIFFSILTRRMLRRGDFASRDDLTEKITRFITTYNHTAKPFRWTYDAKLLRAA
ncbi:MAG: IS630 family transposase [Actinobacteria bacterium]|nr:IS630 family transposase [Actinomycetota bacterium]